MASINADHAPDASVDVSNESRIAALLAENARLAEEVAARDNFLAVAAHELNNALTPVIARVDLLINRLDDWPSEKVHSNLMLIQQATATFSKRATTLLDVSRLTSGKFELDLTQVDVHPVLRDVVEGYRPLAARAGCVLNLKVVSDDLCVRGDQLAIEQILDNLISNAIKYGPGKPISIDAHLSAPGVVTLSVADGGPGISDEARARIFERFERAVRPGDSVAGFGIGLWVVKQLCEAMQGAVTVQAAASSGSIFSIALPRSSKGLIE